VLFQAKNASAHTILCKLGLDYIFGNVGPLSAKMNIDELKSWLQLSRRTRFVALIM